MKTKLYYYYDKEADVFYLSQGKPSAKDQSREAEGDVILRIDPKTKHVRGFTILNFSQRAKNKSAFVSLPIQAELLPV
ncbi:MAG: DUF2283 domain-containing protein [Parcubacteria group bacterium]|nr:DUF2283 domain-containing protein [Parcubacteria group bacterium]